MINQVQLLLVSVILSSSTLIQSLNSQNHNKSCYTQGIFFLNDTHIFESCGLYNKSYFHVMQYTAQPFQLKEVYESNIPWRVNIFLEGSVMFKEHIYILTWKEKVVYKLNPTTYQLVEELTWNRPGWGLTTNGTYMFTSDGSDNIYIVDQSFKLISQKSIINLLGRRLYNINQLQYADGYIYANVYYNRNIYKIDFEKGKVVYEYTGDNLIKAESGLKQDQVINGIAFDKTSGKFLLTGKHWSKIHQVTL